MEDACWNSSELEKLDIKDFLGDSSLIISGTAFILRGWISTFLCYFGLIGNVVSAIILSRPKLRAKAINIILLALTMCDGFYIMLYLLSWSIPTILLNMEYVMLEENRTMINLKCEYLTVFRPIVYPYFYALLWTAQNTSVLYTVFLTVERFIYVCKPLESTKIITQRKTIVICVVILFAVIFYDLPMWWRFNTKAAPLTPIRSNCPTIFTLKKNYGFRNGNFGRIYFHKVKLLILHHLIPLLIVIMLNYKINEALQKIRKRRARLTGSEARNIAYTKIVFCVISLSCITNIVFIVLAVVHYLKHSSTYYQNIYHTLKDLVDMLLLFNSSINFIFYALFGSAFQNELKKMFCRKQIQLGVSTVSDSKANDPSKRKMDVDEKML